MIEWLQASEQEEHIIDCLVVINSFASSSQTIKQYYTNNEHITKLLQDKITFQE